MKLDENVPDSVGEILRSASHDVALAREEDLAGATDDDLLAAASAEGRTLVTLDLDFGDVVRHPPGATAGIVVLRPQRQTLASIQQVATVAGALLEEEVVAERLWIVEPSRVREWPGSV